MPELQEELKKKSEPSKLLRVSTYILTFLEHDNLRIQD